MEVVGTLGYSGQPIELIATDTICYLSGNGLCILDTVKGPKDIIWKSDKGISCWSSHQLTNQIVIAPNIDSGNLALYSLATSQILGHLSNPSAGKIIHFSFSSDGLFLLALSDPTDQKVIMWNLQTFQMILSVDILFNSKCEKCLMHPVDNLSFLLYGSEAILYGRMTEILGKYDLKFHPIQLKIDSKYPFSSTESKKTAAVDDEDDDAERYVGISCAVWSPPNSLIVGTYDGTIYFVEPLSKYSKKLFSIPSKPSDKPEMVTPIGLILCGVHLIVGIGKCQIYWYSFDPQDLTAELLDSELHFQEIISSTPEQIVTLDIEPDLLSSAEMALAGEGHLLTCLICDSVDYSTCIASTSDGMIYKFSSEVQHLTNDEDEDDLGMHDQHQQQLQQQHKPILGSHLPLYTFHSGTVISTHSMSIPISEYSSSLGATLNAKTDGGGAGGGHVMSFDHGENVNVFITGAYSGAVSFWRVLTPGGDNTTAATGSGTSTAAPPGAGAAVSTSPSTSASGGQTKSITGILKSIPRIPQRLCRRYVCERVELEDDINVVPHVITAFETLSLATYGGGRLLAIGTLTGWLEIWRVEAYLSDDTTRQNELQELEENAYALNEEDVLSEIKIGVQLVYRKRFYETAITSIASSDAMSCFALSSVHSPLIYAVNTSPKNKFQDIKVYTLGDQTNQPVSLSWTGPLLWVPTHEGIFFTFLPEMNHDDLLLPPADHDHDQGEGEGEEGEGEEGRHGRGGGGGEDEEHEEAPRVTPALVDLTPIHPKVMWEIESKSVYQALPFTGSGGGCIFIKQDVSMIGLVDNYPTVFDLEHNNLLNTDPLPPGEVPEVPMLQLPGNIKYSIPMSSPIISIARSTYTSMVATGTYDGSIFLWRIKRNEITLLNRYQPHSCAVVNLLFTFDSSQVISCGTDGTIFITLIDKPMLSSSTATSSSASHHNPNHITSLLLENDLYEMKQHYHAISSQKILWKDFYHQEVMSQLKETFKSKSIHFQSIVENIENRLRTLLTRNRDANELEQMELEEFVIDVNRKRELLMNMERRGKQIQEMYAMKSLANELIANRIKQQCWDTMEVHSLTLLPIQLSSSASPASASGAPSGAPSGSGACSQETAARQSLTSFSIEKLKPDEILKFQRIKRLRIIEITSQRQTLQQKFGGHIDHVGNPNGGSGSRNWRCCWGKNIQGTPNAISWLFNDGLRWPCQDIIQLILEQEKQSKETGGGGGGGGATDAATGAAAGGGAGGKDDSKKTNKTVTTIATAGATAAGAPAAAAVAGGARAGGGGDDDEDSYNTSEQMITMEQEINFNNIFNLLYAPQTVRTQIQKRNQIIFLKEIIRLIKSSFNKQYFEKMYHEKEDVMANIQAKNSRIQEILKELASASAPVTGGASGGGGGGGWDEEMNNLNPQWCDVELIDSSITVSDSEIVSRPYETNAMRAARVAEEERRLAEELERNNDSKERALYDMMNGTLEMKRDVLSEAAAGLHKPDWLVEKENAAAAASAAAGGAGGGSGGGAGGGGGGVLFHYEHLTEVQKKEYDEYLNKLQLIQDEKAKYCKGLELEMKKLKVEIHEIMKTYNEKLSQMIRLKILIQREILSQELYITRLSLSMVKREQCWFQLKEIEQRIEKTRQERNEISTKIDELTLRTDEAKVLLTTCQDEEKLLDRSFKRDLQTLCNVTFDQDLLKLFTQLYRLRKYPDNGGGAGGGGGGGHGGTGVGDDDDLDGHVTSTLDGRSSRNSNSNKRRLSLKRSLGGSKGQSRGPGMVSSSTATVQHRRSKGNSISNRGETLGPLQAAAKAMLSEQEGGVGGAGGGKQSSNSMNINPKHPFYSNLLFLDRERRQQESQLPLLQPLNIDVDTPEGFSIDPFVWSKLQELRLNRISKELEVKGHYKSYSELKKKLEMLTVREDEIHEKAVLLRQQKELMMKRLDELMNDLDVMITVRQGQDEVNCDAVVTDYKESKLIPTQVIRKYNDKISELGREKINILIKIKQFRRKMNLVDWEARHLQLEGWHLEEYYTDSQLFRVTRDLQRIIKLDDGRGGGGGGGGGVDQNKVKQDKLSIRKEFMKRDNENKMMKMNALIESLRVQIEERRLENGKYQNKISTLKGEVAVREQVVRASTAGGTGGGTGGRGMGTTTTGRGKVGGGVDFSKTNPVSTLRGDQKMKKIVKRRKLVDTARIQAEEIDYLKQELDKLRQKTFPSFVKATRNRLVYNPDERI